MKLTHLVDNDGWHFATCRGLRRKCHTRPRLLRIVTLRLSKKNHEAYLASIAPKHPNIVVVVVDLVQKIFLNIGLS